MEKEDLELSNSLKLIARSSLIVFLGVIFSKILSYIYKIIIARNFSPEIYGVFALALIILSILTSISSLGFSDGLLRFVSLYNKNEDSKKIIYLFNTSLTWVLTLSLFLGFLLYIFSNFLSLVIFHNPSLTEYLKVLSITIPLGAILSLFLSVIRGFKNIYLYSLIVNVLGNVFKVVLISIFILLGFKGVAIIYSYLFSIIATLIISYLSARQYLKQINYQKEIKKEDKKKAFSDLFSYSWPIVFLSTITTLFYWLDSLILGYFRTASEVGFYSVFFAIVTLLGIAPELFMQLFFPLIVEHFSKKKINTIKEISKQVSKWIFILNLPILLVIIIFPGVIVNILFGASYLGWENSLRVLALGNFVGSLIIPICSNLLSMKGKSKWILFNLLIVSVLNLVFNIILVQKFGIFGVASVTAVTWIVLSCILLTEVYYLFSFTPLKRKMLRICFVSLIPTATLITLSHVIKTTLAILVFSGLLFVLMYLFLILITQCWDKNDWIIFESVKNRIRAITQKT